MIDTNKSIPSIQTSIRAITGSIVLDNHQQYGGFRTSPSDRFQFTRLARIIDVSYESNICTVVWLDQMGVRDAVPITHPYLGHRGHIMAMPEVNSLVIVGFLHGIRPYILAYLPFNYNLMVEVTQFPEMMEDINFANEQYVKTHVELKDYYDITSLTGDKIRKMKDDEIKARICEGHLEQFAIRKPLIEPGQINISSADGAEISMDTNLILTDMNLDEIKMQAEDNSIHFTCMHLYKHTEFGNTNEGQVRRPFAILTHMPKGISEPYRKEGKPNSQDTISDPYRDKMLAPIGKTGRIDLDLVAETAPEWELIYQFNIGNKIPLVEQITACNEFSDATLHTLGEGNLIPLPQSEWFNIRKITITKTIENESGESAYGASGGTGVAKFELVNKDQVIKFVIDDNPFRPIENRWTTFRSEIEKEAFKPEKGSLFAKMNELLGLNKKFFSKLYQELVTIPSSDGMNASANTPVAQKETPSTVQDTGGDKSQELSEVKKRLKALRDNLKSKIAPEQLDLLSDEGRLNQSYQGYAEGDNNNPPLGSLLRTTSGTLVDGHDRVIRDSFSWERISYQMRQQTGAFVNWDRRGSANINLCNLLINTVGMSLYNGFVHRKILETKTIDKYPGDVGQKNKNTGRKTPSQKPDKKIYLPEPIPVDTTSNAGKVLNIDQEDKKNGSDPRDRKPSKAENPEKYARCDIGQVPAIPRAILPPPNESALESGVGIDKIDSFGLPGGKGSAEERGGAAPSEVPSGGKKKNEPIKFLNEFQLKITREAKIKPRNDVIDPNIIGYEYPRTKELDLYSFQVDKRTLEKYNPKLVKESLDSTMMDRPAPYVELTAGNVVDRDGMIIRSSMTQIGLAYDFSINSDKGTLSECIDHEANLDAAYNNMYQSFNSGFMDFGLAYIIEKKNEEVQVRLKVEDSGKDVPESGFADDVAEKTEAKEDKVLRNAYKRTPYKKLGHITFLVNAKSTDSVRTDVKTPLEIEKESVHKKVDERELTAPFENIPESPDIELSMGGVVDNNHTESVKEAIGFAGEKLHYRLKKTVVDPIALSDEYMGLIDRIKTGDQAASGELSQKLDEEKKNVKTDADKEKLADTAKAIQNDLKSTYDKQGGIQPPTKPATKGIITTPGDVLIAKKINTIDKDIEAQEERNKKELEWLKSLKKEEDRLAYLLGSIAEYEEELFFNPAVNAAANALESSIGLSPRKEISSIIAKPIYQENYVYLFVNSSETGWSKYPVMPASSSTEARAAGYTAGQAIPNIHSNYAGFTANQTLNLISSRGLAYFPKSDKSYKSGHGDVAFASYLIDNLLPPETPFAAYLMDTNMNGSKGVPFPLCPLGPGPGSEIQQGKATVATGGKKSKKNKRTFQDPNFPNGAILGPDGKVIKGQGACSGGSGTDPQTGKQCSGVAYGSSCGGVCGGGGSVVPQKDREIIIQYGQNGQLTAGPLNCPLGSSIGNKGCFASFPNPPRQGCPNNNEPLPPIDVQISIIQSSGSRNIDIETIKQPEIIIEKTTQSQQKTIDLSSSNPALPPANAAANRGNIDLFPAAMMPVPATGNGSDQTAKIPKTTIVEIDNTGSWACKSDVQGVNQTIINNLAQLQLGRVIDKDKTNKITNAQSMLGPFSHARLSVSSGAGVDLDALGNLVNYATKDFLIKGNREGEIRSYSDLKIISDKRSVIIQAEGGSPLEANERGNMTGGLGQLPKAEIVVGVLERRDGVNLIPINSAFGNQINVAMIRHLGPDKRSILGIDSDGHLVIQTTGDDKALIMSSSKSSLMLDKVIDKDAAGVPKKAISPNGKDVYARLKTDAGSAIIQDAEGSMFESAKKGLYLEGRIGDGTPFLAQLALGSLQDRSTGSQEKGIFGQNTQVKLSFRDTSTNGLKRELQIDDNYNFAINTNKQDAITLLKSPEGEIQLGRVVDIDINGTVSDAIGAAPLDSKVLFRINLANSTQIAIDINGNAIITLPRTITIRSEIGDINIEAPRGNINLRARNITATATDNITSRSSFNNTRINNSRF